MGARLVFGVSIGRSDEILMLRFPLTSGREIHCKVSEFNVFNACCTPKNTYNDSVVAVPILVLSSGEELGKSMGTSNEPPGGEDCVVGFIVRGVSVWDSD